MSRQRICLVAVTAACILLPWFALVATAAPKEPTTQDRISIAARLRDRRMFTQAQKACETILAEGNLSPRQMEDVYSVLIDAFRRDRKYEGAIAASDRMAASLKDQPDAVMSASSLKVDLYWEWGKKDQAAAAARKFVDNFANDKPACAKMLLKLCSFLLDMKSFKDCHDVAAKVIELSSSDDSQTSQALGYMQESAWRAGDYENCLEPLQKLLAPKMLAQRPRWERNGLYLRCSDCLVKLNRPADAVAFFDKAIPTIEEGQFRQELLFRRAQIVESQGDLDAALAAYERLFTENPEQTDYWARTQRTMVELLRKLNRPNDALQAAHICLDAAADPNAATDAARVIVTILRDMDKNVVRANAFIEFQTFGPAGKDGKEGTSDDLKDPLASVGYPSYPDREKAFAQARQSAGDNTAASRIRAMTYLYTGHPADALQHFADAFRRCTGTEFRATGQDLVAIGVRAAVGHAAGLGRFYAFLQFGPAGPDGRAGTDDDLKDPFGELGVKQLTDEAGGGLADIPEADRKNLNQLRIYVEQIVAGERDDAALRQDAAQALERIHVALSDWGRKGQKDWYVHHLLRDQQAQVQVELAEGGQASARGGELHLAGVREFWQQVDAGLQGAGAGFPRQLQVSRNACYEQAMRAFERPVSFIPRLQPLKK